MTHSPAAQTYVEKEAGALCVGDRVLLPGGRTAAEIRAIGVEADDFGVPALLLLSTDDGVPLRIAVGSAVSVAGQERVSAAVSAADPDPGEQLRTDAGSAPSRRSPGSNQGYSAWADATAPEPGMPASNGGTPAEDRDVPAPAVVVPPLPPLPPAPLEPSAEELALIPEPIGTPESVVANAAAAHPGRMGVSLLSERLTKGINTKSGSCLRDLSDLAYELYVVLKDPLNALRVADLLNVLPFDGNPGRWSSIERSLSLSAHIAREEGRPELAAVYEKLLRAPETGETDPFKARMNARVRQRALNEPNLYDKEIFRAMDNSNHEAEREWRLLRLDALLFLRAHGGSETIAEGELERRIGNELDAIRA